MTISVKRRETWPNTCTMQGLDLSQTRHEVNEKKERVNMTQDSIPRHYGKRVHGACTKERIEPPFQTVGRCKGYDPVLRNKECRYVIHPLVRAKRFTATSLPSRSQRWLYRATPPG